ncbi:MAG: DUF3185 family protein [Sphaerochaeta sp.]|nr:DUF3185 family protein [Sphaerochaeta sp.]
MSRVIGILLLVGGTALLVGGYFASQSVEESLRTFLGFAFTKETLWFLIGGAAAFVGGLFILMGRR